MSQSEIPCNARIKFDQLCINDIKRARDVIDHPKVQNATQNLQKALEKHSTK